MVKKPAQRMFVDAKEYTNMCAHVLESTPWTVGVDPSLLIVT